jgi:hypothetical protein
MSRVKRVPPKIERQESKSSQSSKSFHVLEAPKNSKIKKEDLSILKLDFTPVKSEKKSILFSDMPTVKTSSLQSSVMSEPKSVSINKLDCWIPVKSEYRRPIIIGYTVAGMYKRLPTEKRIGPISATSSRLMSGPLSGKRIERIRQQSLPGLKISPSLPEIKETEDNNSSETVSENIHLSDLIKNKHIKMRNSFIECPDVDNMIDSERFQEILLIYENNQVYYQQSFDDGKIDKEKLVEKLICLERWFICIIEPKPYKKSEISDWMEREKMKLVNYYSEYCDPDIYKYFTQEDLYDKKIIKYIKTWHAKLNIE